MFVVRRHTAHSADVMVAYWDMDVVVVVASSRQCSLPLVYTDDHDAVDALNDRSSLSLKSATIRVPAFV